MPIKTRNLIKDAGYSINDNKLLGRIFKDNILLAGLITGIIIIIIGVLYQWKGEFVKMTVLIWISCFVVISIHDSILTIQHEEDKALQESETLGWHAHSGMPTQNNVKPSSVLPTESELKGKLDNSTNMSAPMSAPSSSPAPAPIPAPALVQAPVPVMQVQSFPGYPLQQYPPQQYPIQSQSQSQSPFVVQR